MCFIIVVNILPVQRINKAINSVWRFQKGDINSEINKQ